jgi:ribonucleoside-diphosphate reductase alpha chain
MEIVKKSVSTGYVRQNMPTLTVFSGGQRPQEATAFLAAESVSLRADGTTGQAAIHVSHSHGGHSVGGSDKASRRAEARMKGYEGDSCGECGNFTLVRNGTCMKCDTCGSTSGCS